MAPTKSNGRAAAKPGALRKSARRKPTAARPARGPNDKENEPAGAKNDGRESLLQGETDDEREKNWWLINVEKAASLIDRCMKEYGWERDEAKRILGAYRHFLLLKKEHADWDETKLWPCWAVETMWEEHSKMDDYAHDMLDLLGHAVSRGQDISGDEQNRLDDATVDALKGRFGAYDADLWDKQDIIIQDQLGEDFVFGVYGMEPLQNVFEDYFHVIEVEATEDEKHVFEFDGKRLGGKDTLSKLGIEDRVKFEVNRIDKVAVTFRTSSGEDRTVLARKTEMISKLLVRDSEESDEDSNVDFFKERNKYVFLHGGKRIYGFESPIALDMQSRGNEIAVVPSGEYKCKNCVCCNPSLAAKDATEDAEAAEDSADDASMAY